MNKSSLSITTHGDKLSLKILGEFTLFIVSKYNKQIEEFDFSHIDEVFFDLKELLFLDTTAALFINSLINFASDS